MKPVYGEVGRAAMTALSGADQHSAAREESRQDFARLIYDGGAERDDDMASSIVNSARRELPRWALDTLVLATLVGLAVVTFVELGSPQLLDIDDANLAASVLRFDVTNHQPHPPGYLGYVLILKVVHLLSGLPAVTVTRVVSRAFALAAMLVTWRAALRFMPSARAAALWAAALVALHPIVLFYGVDAQTHSAETALSAGLLWVLAADTNRRSPRRAIGIGLLLAAGGSLRASYALVCISPLLWAYWRNRRDLIVIAAVAAAGTAAWLTATVVLTPGGWASYRAVSETLLGSLARITSPISPTADASLLQVNLLDTAAWTLLALAPALLALLARGRALFAVGAAARRPAALLALMAAPALVFYLLVLCAEAGYLSALVPPAAIVAALALEPRPGSRAGRRWLRPAVLLAEMGFFWFAPRARDWLYMMPNADEILAREARIARLHEHVMRGKLPHQRLLVLSDYREPGALRQLPLLFPDVEVLFFVWRNQMSLVPSNNICLASPRGWIGLFAPPGTGPEALRSLSTEARYDAIVLDPRTSNAFRRELRGSTGCPVPARENEPGQVRLPTDCFAGGIIRVADCTFRFGVSD